MRSNLRPVTVNAIKKAIFLDRDGCISPDEFGYISDASKYRLYDYTPEALRLFKSLGYMLFIVTNQSGIARGYFGFEELKKVHERMEELLKQEQVHLDGIYFSPYYAGGSVSPWNIEHPDRKPGPGMYQKALKQHPFQSSASWMIGDRYTDIAFGKSNGLRSILLLSGNGQNELKNNVMAWEHQPDFICEDLLTAAKLIQNLKHRR